MKKYFIAPLYAALVLFPVHGHGEDASAHLSIHRTVDKAGQVLPPQQSGSETVKADHGQVQSRANEEQTQNPKNPQDAQKIFEESLRQMMPLNEGQDRKSVV